MNWTLSFLGMYLLRCSFCGLRRLRLGYSSALSTCYHHDDYCQVQMAERLEWHRSNTP